MSYDKFQIYCESEFVHDVQLSHIYPDSKTFVDKKFKRANTEILNDYRKLKENNNNEVPSNSQLIQFIDENLEDGDELENWTPSDFTEDPPFIRRIRDEQYRQWAYGLNYAWKTLARKIKDDVKLHPDRYTLIWVPNGFIVPGGRFRELYYWDTYWIVNGLLLCDMKATARGIIDNIISMVNEFGFMPNGGRLYYLNRSQPPMLILMALSHYKATNDFEYVRSIISVLEIEFQFWIKNRSVTFQKDGKTYIMARYYAPSRGPRPESYREDYEMAERLYDTVEKKNDFYSRIKSVAETGWDFSSRWFITTANNLNSGTLSDTQTPKIVPVDLNSILQVNAATLSVWFDQMGMTDKAKEYGAISERFIKNIQEVMWRADRGAWFDWDLLNHRNREKFYVSNIIPLWTKSYNMPKKTIAKAVLGYLKDHRIIEPDYSVSFHGIPTSMYASSQQWDFPNAWPPLQAFIIQGLDRTQQKLAQQVAANLAEVWLRSNYKGYTKKSFMFEKYNVLTAGETGSGGEYSPQIGFGWTNGVVFELLNRWSDVTSSSSKKKW